MPIEEPPKGEKIDRKSWPLWSVLLRYGIHTHQLQIQLGIVSRLRIEKDWSMGQIGSEFLLLGSNLK